MPSRTRDVCAATAVSTVSGSSQWPSGPVGWRPPSTPPVSARPYASRSSPNTTWSETSTRSTPASSAARAQSKTVRPVAGILGRERRQGDRQPRRHARSTSVSRGAERSSAPLRHAVAEGQVLDAAVDDRAQALHRPGHLEPLQPRRAGGGRSSRARRAPRARPCRSARRSRTRGAGSGAGRPGTRTDPRTPPRRGSPTRSTARPAHRRGSSCRAPRSPRSRCG